MLVDHRQTTIMVPRAHVSVLKRTALELDGEGGRLVTSADLIRLAIADMVHQLLHEPHATLRLRQQILSQDRREILNATIEKPALPPAPPTSAPELPSTSKRRPAKRGGRRR